MSLNDRVATFQLPDTTTETRATQLLKQSKKPALVGYEYQADGVSVALVCSPNNHSISARQILVMQVENQPDTEVKLHLNMDVTAERLDWIIQSFTSVLKQPGEFVKHLYKHTLVGRGTGAAASTARSLANKVAATTRKRQPPLDARLSGISDGWLKRCTKVNGIVVCQPKVAKQWHPNSCGYHAVFNALSLMHLADRFCASEPCDKAVELLQSDDRMMESMVVGLSKLAKENHASKRWTAGSIESGTVDQLHMEFLVDHVYGFGDHVTVVPSVEAFDELVPEKLLQCRKEMRAHGFILGSIYHWVAAVACFDPKSQEPFILFADSYNKDQLAAKNDDTAFLLATECVQRYRSKFVNKMKCFELYKHLPEEELAMMYEHGIPEWWKGKKKSVLWWDHKPASLRTQLMFQEIQSTNHYVQKYTDSLRWLLALDSIPEHNQGSRKKLVLLRSNSHKASTPSGVISNALIDGTKHYFPSYVRKEQNWPEDSEEYKAGNSIENRKIPPKPQVTGDVFDRQRVIVEFDQGLVERQSCLVIGTGGIGQNTALSLSRIGVDRIFLIDFDTVEASNLTRQCLVSLKDIGKSKTEASKANLDHYHGLRTKVSAFNLNVIDDWPTVVELAKQSTVIFNCVDVGLMFDYCVNSLSKELEVPLISGQSFAWKMMMECYSGKPDKICAFCQETTERSFGLDDRMIARPGGLLDRLRGFLSTHPAEAGGFVVDSPRMTQFLRTDKQFRLSGEVASRVVQQAASQRADGVHGEPLRLFEQRSAADVTAEMLKGFLQRYHDICMQELAPGSISRLSHLGFMPRPAYPETRFFGSWVGPCLGCGNLMVTQWVNSLTGPTGRNPPTNIVFNLDEGMTAEEQMGYELTKLGMGGMDASSRTFIQSTSEASCTVCAHAQRVSYTEKLLFGSRLVYLSPVPGEVHPVHPFLAEPALTSFRHQRTQVAKSRYGSNPLVQAFGDDYANIVLPCIPAVDPVTMVSGYLDFYDADDQTAVGKCHGCPIELGYCPLVKMDPELAAQHPSSVQGYASGKRSSLVNIRNQWYRLKGCGNLDQGFPLEVTGDHGERSVRGCCYEHTAGRELHMTTTINKILEDTQVIPGGSANTPLGYYKYAMEPEHLVMERYQNVMDASATELRLEWPLPDITRYCTVFKTRGDRRLGDHLLAGMNVLLPGLASVDAEHLGKLRRAVQQGRGMDENGDVWDTATLCECGMDVFVVPPNSQVHHLLGDHAPSPGTTVPAEYAEFWEETCAALRRALGGNPRSSTTGSVLLYVAWRIGWECGRFCKCLADHDISWGTFPDADGIHCNAHANNMVVDYMWSLDHFEEHDRGVMLRPLDFDMAFTKDTFVPELVEMSNQQAIFPSSWKDLVHFEQRMGMRTSLAGSDFTSTGVKNSLIEVPEGDQEAVQLVRALFRDTIVAGFDQAVADKEDLYPQTAEQDELARLVVQLALVMTSEVVA